ncbi:MAG: radical SAM protein [Prevotellaceae bacterium]|jgi:MoaA/NifB/PqqE/SkfB family radical SAM enzyme|nr:radical SAM protein [Prevotellaceae bacterium]
MKEKAIVKIKYIVRRTIGSLIPDKILRSNYNLFLKVSGKNLKRRKLFRFEVHLTEHCNLNCKYCNHFSPLAEKEFLNIESFERDLARISELTERKIELVNLLGGEPLLHPQLMDILSLTRKYFDTGKIVLITNGTLLLKQPDAFWQNCKQNDIELRITYYPIKLDRPAISGIAKEHGVTIRYMGGGVKTMSRVPLDLNGTQNAKNSFLQCYQANNCVFLENGKIYTCPVIPNIRHFNHYFKKDLQISANDYIDIYKVKNVDEIFDFLCKPVPFCRYCNLKETVYELQWEHSKKEISEWV